MGNDGNDRALPLALSRAIHRAINEREFDDLGNLLDDEVDWAIYGPIDMFPFLGARRGKVAVLEVVRQIAENFRVHRFDRQTILLGIDAAASMIRYSLTSLNPTSRSRFALRISRSSRPDG